jgi:phospholipid/cholesterol/gamma-HCH transport system ATP-binding protein
MDDQLVEIRNLTFRRGRRVIFDDIDLAIPRGKITAVMGPSGTGKTTLLRLIGGQLRPAAGSVRVDGVSVPDLGRKALYALRRRMGMLFQSGALLTDLSVFENVAFPLREHTDLPEALVRDVVLMKLELVGLRGAWRLMPDELSGGMARRVALARAIVLDPMVVLYDEPFVGLDPISMGVIVRLIRRLNDALGLTSVIVTHDVHEVTAIADMCYLLSEGKIMGAGSPRSLAASDSEWVRQFMNGLDDGPVPFHYPAADYARDLLGGAA